MLTNNRSARTTSGAAATVPRGCFSGPRARCLAAVGAALLASACAQPEPCSGNGCLPVAGSYIFRLNPSINCPAWEASSSVTPSAPMQVTQFGSQLTMTLWPANGNPTHNFTGTLFADGTIQVSENSQNVVIGVPYGIISGAFISSGAVPKQAPFFFSGSLLLQGSIGTTGANGTLGPTTGPSAGKSTGCTGTSQFTAQEQGFTNGPVPDGGIGDGGNPSGDGGA